MDPETLVKHAHHIRALTCTFEVVPALLEANLDKVVELNIMYDHSLGYREFPRKDMVKVISRCPRLCAVSIEDLDFHIPSDSLRLQKFVYALKKFPAITCLYISFGYFERNDINQFYAILGKRLARVDSNAITSLAIKSCKQMTRSKRGPPVESGSGGRQYRWQRCIKPVEEEIEHKYRGYTTFERDTSPGRWEQECQKKSASCLEYAIAVLENDGTLEVCLPPLLDGCRRIHSLLERYPALTKLSITENVNFVLAREFKVAPLAESYPHLCELEWHFDWDVQPGNFSRNVRYSYSLQWLLQDANHTNLSSVSLQGMSAVMFVSIVRPLVVQEVLSGTDHFLRHVLVSLTVMNTDYQDPRQEFPLAYMLEVLTRCPKLQVLSVGRVCVDGTEQGLDLPWACLELRSLQASINVKDPEGSWEAVEARKTVNNFEEKMKVMRQLKELSLNVTYPTNDDDLLEWTGY
ncbi:hypothetical protein MVEG_09302 [Podila verticillata NRRL 6337]|nr:hypothetical protein MVEG_09302 [Podila verticillata NRRL 6337]